MLEWVWNMSAFNMHLTMLCVIITNFQWDVLNSYMAPGNLPSFEYSRKIALTTSLRKVRRGRYSSSLSQLIQYIIHAPCRTTSSIQTNGYCHHFFIQIAVMCLATFCFILSNVLVVTVKLVWLLLLKYFHSTCSNADQISVRLTRVKRSYVKCPTVVLTSPTSYTVFLLDVRFAVESSRVPFFATVCL